MAAQGLRLKPQVSSRAAREHMETSRICWVSRTLLCSWCWPKQGFTQGNWIFPLSPPGMFSLLAKVKNTQAERRYLL